MDNEEVKNKINWLTKVARGTIKHDRFNVKTIKTGNKVLKPDAAGQLVLSSSGNNNDDNNGNGGNNGNNGNNVNPNYPPDSGVNINPGDNLMKLEQLWSGTTDPTTTTEVVFTKDIANIGDGLQIKLNIFKKAVTNGLTADTQQSLTPVASTEPKAQAGKYVLNVPYPVSILAKNLVVGKTMNVTLDGVGEALETTKVSQAMVMSILVKDSRTLAITCHQGYALDKTTSGNNGAFYTFQATYINSFTIAPKIEQMVNGTELFTGAATNGEIKLKGVLDGFANVGDGIAVYFAKDFKFQRKEGDSYEERSIPVSSAFNISNPMIILKPTDLVSGKVFPIKFKIKAGDPFETVAVQTIEKDNSSLTINFNSITLINDSLIFDTLGSQNWPSSLKIVKVTSVTNAKTNK